MNLPDWLNRDAWEGWVEQRKRSRHPLSERAQKMWLKDLTEWHDTGYDTTWILNEAEKKDWRGLFLNNRTPRVRQATLVSEEPLSPKLQAVRDRVFARERKVRSIA